MPVVAWFGEEVPQEAFEEEEACQDALWQLGRGFGNGTLAERGNLCLLPIRTNDEVRELARETDIRVQGLRPPIPSNQRYSVFQIKTGHR